MPPLVHDRGQRYPDEYDDEGDFRIPRQLSSPIQHLESQSSLPNPGRVRSLISSAEVCDRLEKLPELRRIPWRSGQELSLDESVYSTRVNKRGATLLVTRGKIAHEPCALCAAGHGRFSLCVSLDDWFKGACACCEFMSRGKNCSFREQNGESLETPDRMVLNSQKRKRRSKQEMQSIRSSNSNSQQKQAEPVSPNLESLLQAEIAREEYGQNTAQSQRGLEAEKPHFERQLKVARKDSGESNAYRNSNQSHRSIQKVYAAGQVFPEQLPGPSGSAAQAGPPFSNALPVIDTLPRSKQRQIYGIMSGLQGGIDNLQQQLDSFKTLLGIDTDDDGD